MMKPEHYFCQQSKPIGSVALEYPDGPEPVKPTPSSGGKVIELKDWKKPSRIKDCK